MMMKFHHRPQSIVPAVASTRRNKTNGVKSTNCL